MRLARDRAGGYTPGKPPSCVPQGRVRDRTGQAALLPAARAGGLHPGRAAFLPAARAGGCTPGKLLSCLRQGRGVAPRASRLLACGKGGGLVSAARRKHAGVYGRPTLSTRLAAGGSCPFLGLAAGEASPAPPGRGLCPLPSPLKGALPPRPPNGGCVAARDKPPSCLRQGRGVAPQASRPLAYGKSGGFVPAARRKHANAR